jgi:FkbM family methyltransferase
MRLLKSRLLRHTPGLRRVSDRKRSQIFEEFVDAIKGANLFIDGGANIGTISQLALSINSSSNFRVHAFEPDPTAYSFLANIVDDRLDASPKALWVKNEQKVLFRHVEFERNSSTTSSSLNSTKSNISTRHSQIVDAVDVAEVLNNDLGTKIVLKLDVEGVEYELIHHLLNKDSLKNIQYIFCEFHPLKIRFGIVKHIILICRLLVTGNREKFIKWI